jgi:para-nitrobenzyl esterase
VAAVVVVVAAAVAGCSSGTAGPVPGVGGADEVVSTSGGPVQGREDGPVVRFSGIPYAAAPTGDLRFAPPSQPAPWSGVRDATRPGPVCPQATATLLPGQVPAEDCLSVNVTAPAVASPGLRPVLVWLHGGGFVFGSGSDYDASSLASRGDLVVVTVNYRLGIFGGLSLPEMPEHNVGLQDQIAALRWVRDNATAFGADPDNVTLAGESAGALSTCSLLASPATDGLFARAIIASGSCRMRHPAGALSPTLPAVSTWNSVEATDAYSRSVAASVGCTDPATVLGCLRAQPVDDLVALGPAFTTLAVGGAVLPRDPGEKPRADWATEVPVLSGNTSDEHLGNVLSAYPAATAQTYRSALSRSFGPDVDQVARRYPLDQFPDPVRALARVYSDNDWICPTVSTNRDYARTAPVWTYLFSDPEAPTPTGETVPRPAAVHGSDVVYTLPLAGQPSPLAPGQQHLADQMIDYWAAFARTGDPNGPGRPSWPATTPGFVPALELTPEPGPRPIDASTRCS